MVTKLPDVPVILDKPKTRIRSSIVNTVTPSYQLNLFSQLIGGALETKACDASTKSYKETR